MLKIGESSYYSSKLSSNKGSNKMAKYLCVYIMANKRNGTLYTGVTSNLAQRVYQHKTGLFEGFSKKYKCINLAYYEELIDMPTAILREKQLKGGSRKKRLC
jgi:putative endonuclease